MNRTFSYRSSKRMNCIYTVAMVGGGERSIEGNFEWTVERIKAEAEKRLKRPVLDVLHEHRKLEVCHAGD